MADLNVPPKPKWHRHQGGRSMPPFQSSQSALAVSGFTVGAAQEDIILSPRKCYVEEESIELGLSPKFDISIDWNEFQQDTGMSSADVEVVIVARDRLARSYTTLERWPADQTPESWQATTPFDSFDGVEFFIAICLAQAGQKAPGVPYRRGSILSFESISVRPKVDALSFPTQAVVFEDDRLWQIAWADPEPNYNLKPRGLFEIQVNSKVFDLLQLMTASVGAGAILARMLAAEYFEAFARPALAADYDNATAEQDETDPSEGLRALVLQSLSKATGRTPEDLIDRARSEDTNLLRADVQICAGIVQAASGAVSQGLLA